LTPHAAIMTCGELPPAAAPGLLGRYGLQAQCLAADLAIPGSYWGEPEAGLRGSRIYFRADTPVHSLLHEASHFVCMTPERRRRLDTNAGSDDAEECAVCYLEILLANCLAPFSSTRCLRDMDAWGYSFREGSARAWFSGDGRDARNWLFAHSLIDSAGQPSWRLRA
jgi:hypothetical protein